MVGGMIVGLTGGIGSGKSTVASILTGLGARVIDADEIGHAVYAPGTEGFSHVVATFGQGVVGADGTIDRRALGEIVFTDPAALGRLNAIVHPLIAAELVRRVCAARADGYAGPVVIEAAVLIEAGWRALVDQLWVVSVDPATAVERVCRTRGLSREEAERRVDAQLSDQERARHADVVIDNRSTPAALRARVEEAWRERAV